MQAQLRSFNGERWALGLSWLTFTRKPPVKEINAIVKNDGAPYVALRESSAYQIGLYRGESKRMGKKGSIFALAAAMATSQSTPWRGLFQLDETTWWYIAVRDNFAITLDGDVVGDREALSKIKESHDYFDDWNDVEGGTSEIEALLSKSGVQKIALIKSNAKPAFYLSLISVGLLLTAMASYGGFLYAKKLQLAEIQKKVALSEIKASAKPTHPPVAPKPKTAPDAPVPRPQSMLSTCWDAVRGLPLEYRGRLLQQAQCQFGAVTIQWGPATAHHDDAAAPNLQGFIEQGGQAFTNFQLPQVQMGVAPATRVGASLDALKSFAKEAGLMVSVQNGDAAKTLGSQSSFTLTGPMSPDLLAAALGQIPGLSIQTVTWQVTTGWTYAGVIL